MNIFLNLILAVQLLSALTMIGLILIQHGKGADMGAAFGSGGAGSLFGASGSANFMSRTTAVLATVFFVCTLALAYFGGPRQTGLGSVLDNQPPVVAPAAPAEVPGASQVPGAAPASAPAPAAAASDAGQVPTK